MSKSLYLNQEHALSQHDVPGWYGFRTDVPLRRPVAPQDHYWRRFLEIYHGSCGAPEAALPSLILRTERCFIASDEEVALADEFFVQELGKVTRSKSLWRSQKRSDGKEYITATAALLRVVQEGGTPGVAQCIVRKGGKIILSKDPQKQIEQISQRHGLIIVAAKLGRTLLVDYLATISPPERLAQALAISVRADDVMLTKELLEHGASPDSLFQAIPDHFALLSSAMLELLLQSPTPPSNSSRSRWLISAFTSAKLDLAIVLLRYGEIRDVDYLDLLRKEIEKVHLQAFLVALKFMHGSGAMYFDGLLQQIVKSPDMSFADKILATEATLCVAQSNDGRAFSQRLRADFLLDQDTSAALEICAASGQIGLVELLRQPRFDAKVSSKTMESAIQALDLHLLDHLYPKRSSRVPQDFLLAALPTIEDRRLSERLLLRLLQLQVQGPYLDKELVLAVKVQNMTLIRSLMNMGAKADYNDGEALIIAVEGDFVRLVQELLPQTTRAVRSVVFARLRAKEKLPRRLMTKLFIEKGISRDVLHSALRDSVCECAPFRDEALIVTLTAAGADCRMVEASDMDGLVDQGDFHSVADLLKRIIKSTTSPHTISAFASQLLDRLVRFPTKMDDCSRHQMMKLLLNYKATGDCVMVAFEKFNTSGSTDEDLLCLFLTPTVPNRTDSYNAMVSRVLHSLDIWVLYRLIPNIVIYDKVLELVLMAAACSALSDDTGTAERLRCLLTRVEPKNPMLEQGLDHHIRTYRKQCSHIHEWPLKTIDILISKGFAGTASLCHALLALTEAENVDVLSKVLSSAGEICSKDIVDSVLLLAVQHQPACNLRVLETLLTFGASQDGLDMALLTASEIAEVQVSGLLLQHGAEVNYRSGSCLITALRQDRRSVFECLLAQGNAKALSLTEAWIFITEPSSKLSPASKVGYCRNILKAAFCGSQVQAFLSQSIVSMNPDYEMIATILDESQAIKEERELRGYGNGESGTQSTSQCKEPKLLLEALACAVMRGNGRLCRLVLTYLPAGSRIPVDLFKIATSTSTAILALLVNHIPPTVRQEALDICLAQAASYAGSSGICTYLLYEGASCEARMYSAISAATKRALQYRTSDRAPLGILRKYPLPLGPYVSFFWVPALSDYLLKQPLRWQILLRQQTASPRDTFLTKETKGRYVLLSRD
jgi:hypothetical protein